jgi:hypothetical protein
VANQVNGIEVPKAEPAPSGLGQYFRRWLDPLKAPRTPTPQRVPMPPGFDPDAYLKANPDVAVSGIDPAKHWVEFGQREGRPLR